MTPGNQQEAKQEPTNEILVDEIIKFLADGNPTAEGFLHSIARWTGYSNASIRAVEREVGEKKEIFWALRTPWTLREGDPKPGTEIATAFIEDQVTDPKLIAQIFRNIAEMDLNGSQLQTCREVIQETVRSIEKIQANPKLLRQPPVPGTALLGETPPQRIIPSPTPSEHVPLKEGTVRGDTSLSPEKGDKDFTTSLAEAYLQKVGSSGLTGVYLTRDLYLKIFSEKNPDLVKAMIEDINKKSPTKPEEKPVVPEKKRTLWNRFVGAITEVIQKRWPRLIPVSDSPTKPEEKPAPPKKKENLLNLLDKLENRQAPEELTAMIGHIERIPKEPEPVSPTTKSFSKEPAPSDSDDKLPHGYEPPSP